jgi:hypothetical protein
MPIVIGKANIRFSKSQFDIMENYKPFITKGFLSLIGSQAFFQVYTFLDSDWIIICNIAGFYYAVNVMYFYICPNISMNALFKFFNKNCLLLFYQNNYKPFITKGFLSLIGSQTFFQVYTFLDSDLNTLIANAIKNERT